MQLMREAVAQKLSAYVHHEMSLDELVAWANAAMVGECRHDGNDVAEASYGAICDAVARLGLADVRAFGLTWEDCASILKQQVRDETAQR